VDPKLFGSMGFVAFVFAVICGVVTWQDWKVYASSSPTPKDVRLAELTTHGADGNLHVRVTGLRFGNSYVTEKKNGRWTCVWIPVLAEDGRVRGVVKSFRVGNEVEMVALSQRPEVTGIVINELNWLGSSQISELQRGYPGIDLSSLPLIQHARPFPTAFGVRAMTSATAGLLILASACAVASVLGNRRAKQRAAAGLPATTEAPAIASPEGEKLGPLQRVFSTGTLGKNAIVGGILLLFLFGGIATFALTHTKPEELYLGYSVMGSLGLLFVLLILFGCTSLNDRAELHADGLVSRRRRKIMACRWDEVESVAGLLQVPTRFQPAYLGGPPSLCRRENRPGW
jgi:hypothetical protein